MNLNDYGAIIPIGSNCRIGMALRDLGLRKRAFPLDWTLTTARSVYECFENRFDKFLSHETCTEQNLKHIVNFQHTMNCKYNVNITHEPRITSEAIKKYERKVHNLYDSIESSDKILLIRNMLDCEILDVLHRHIAFEEKSLGFEHFDLEWIYKTKDLVQKQYKDVQVDLLVIYFNEENVRNAKREGVFYRTSKYPKQGKEWDRFACQQILRDLM